MTKSQEARERMFRNIIGISDENKGIIENLPNYPANLGVLKTIVIDLGVATREQKIDTKGVRKYKLEQRTLLTVLGADNARKLASYAKLTNNTVLLGQVNYTESDFKRFTDESLKDYAQLIYECAEPIVSQLSNYDINTDTQSAFLNAINNYTEVLVSPNITETIRKQATKKMVLLLAAGDVCIANLAAAVEVVRLKEPIFYLGFKTAQKLIVKGKTKLAVKGQITDANGNPLARVKITVILNGAVVLSKKTAAKGGFYISSLAGGTYQFTFKKTGLAEQTIDVIVNAGELTKLKVIMVNA
jgi:hypothetical protein